LGRQLQELPVRLLELRIRPFAVALLFESFSEGRTGRKEERQKGRKAESRRVQKECQKSEVVVDGVAIFTVQAKVNAVWKRTDTSLSIAPKKWFHKGADSHHIVLACHESVAYDLNKIAATPEDASTTLTSPKTIRKPIPNAKREKPNP
jgi:hypothetical protein